MKYPDSRYPKLSLNIPVNINFELSLLKVNECIKRLNKLEY